MDIQFKYGKEDLFLQVPDNSKVYTADYPLENRTAEELLLHSITTPVGGLPLKQLVQQRKKGHVVIVVSDITRPIPYRSFLPSLLDSIIKEGVRKEEIILLVATGMHRPSTQEEKTYMFGELIATNYRIIDHQAEDENNLAALPGKSWSGTEVRLNRYYVEAGFRILTGLVEPHFMAGFSGGRKAICPGLASLETIQMFHGYEFLNNPNAANAVLEGNPCHLENSSIARLCPADFSINIVLDQHKQLHTIISGEPFLSHEATIAYLKERCCKVVDNPADLAITSCGGYPLDETFYQCVKGFVNCLPALKENGSIIAFGSCTEGIGSSEYESLMKAYSGRIDDFLKDIKEKSFFIKDQWQFQMQIRVLKKVGINNLHFYTAAIPQKELELLSIHAHAISKGDMAAAIQLQINGAVALGKTIAVLPEGPYCSPVIPDIAGKRDAYLFSER
ncbi:MAG: nickel-dependent lactate racemase [Tannerellaceae bacterium]|jgi:nickel-dependent lactate racemase|nr:nickel-dependent lactate racemase [Tannerellaceae bacterium]